ncbi:hypothetical protein IGI04_029601 [Brassica rapa subsp. trilocularis]|uniref:Uncharacterized protein n=1 Tax=Brassica rapa subsp. trilocularis TaxID=1813537 RepID=A0ABQ7LR26_BRACM|nr:hypothetical protein IGI04_029601 [Brassica rapa subsp. trilocularis]
MLTYLVKYFRGGGRLKPRLRGSLAEAISQILKMQFPEMICISSRSTTGGHSEALSDGVRCGLSLVALELALCVVELAIVYSSCELCVCLVDQAFWCHWCALDADVLGEVLPWRWKIEA